MLRRLSPFVIGVACGAAALVGVTSLGALQKEYKSGIVFPEPAKVDAGPIGTPPSDAIVLFDGKDLSKWKKGENWEIKDGYAIAKKSDITTKDSFGDCQLHLEFATPEKVAGSGQGRGNSGVKMMDRYEIQILDSWNNPTYFDGQCASVYKQGPPLVNVSRKPGEWQTYDIIWEVPHFNDDGTVKRPAYVTVLHNGVVVQNDFEVLGTTAYDQAAKYKKHPEKQPFHLQFHGNPVKFRNIWIREIKPMVGKKPDEK